MGTRSIFYFNNIIINFWQSVYAKATEPEMGCMKNIEENIERQVATFISGRLIPEVYP